MSNWVQILDKADCISSNTLAKRMHLTIPYPAMGRELGKQDFLTLRLQMMQENENSEWKLFNFLL